MKGFWLRDFGVPGVLKGWSKILLHKRAGQWLCRKRIEGGSHQLNRRDSFDKD